jgi:hypothetical protein
MKTNYVRLVRNDDDVIVESFEADTEFAMLRHHIEQQQQLIKDLRELLDKARQIALEAVDKTIKGAA